MRPQSFFNHPVVRNLSGLLALVILHFIIDYPAMTTRSGISKFSPYIFLLMMYGWIVFHNRILFEKLFLKGKRIAYFGWAGLGMVLCSANMYYIITTSFDNRSPVPQIVSFWVYTVAGLGVYLTWRSLIQSNEMKVDAHVTTMPLETGEAQLTTFSYSGDGVNKEIPYSSIYYIESLENYVRIINAAKLIVVRLTLKEVERQLPRPQFLRIGRSHIVNMHLVDMNNGDVVTIKGQELKVGKVFKKYVENYSRKS